MKLSRWACSRFWYRQLWSAQVQKFHKLKGIVHDRTASTPLPTCCLSSWVVPQTWHLPIWPCPSDKKTLRCFMLWTIIKVPRRIHSQRLNMRQQCAVCWLERQRGFARGAIGAESEDEVHWWLLERQLCRAQHALWHPRVRHGSSGQCALSWQDRQE